MAVEELYCSLNKLLEDICKFLSDESNFKNLSPTARKHADELINRSKHQLQEISKVTNDCDGAYVDMEKKSVESSEDDKDNIYSSVDEVILSNSTVTTQPPQNPYSNLPAKELDQDLKHGSLSWRCRIILKFEKMRKIYAGVHNNWLLIYSNEKDCKPMQTFNLRHHKAQNIPCKQGKNLSQDFEIFTTVGEKKSFYFMALTHKDMLQWVAQINKCYDSFHKIDPSFIVEEDELSETYDIIINANLNHKESDEDGSEVIYHAIETLSPNYEAENLNKPPELPLRRPPKSPLPVVPLTVEENKEKSTDSLSNDTEKSIESLSSDSFSEDEDEDAIYESFVPKVPEKKGVGNIVQIDRQRNEENRNTTRINSVQGMKKPVTPVKPKFLGRNSNSFKK